MREKSLTSLAEEFYKYGGVSHRGNGLTFVMFSVLTRALEIIGLVGIVTTRRETAHSTPQSVDFVLLIN